MKQTYLLVLLLVPFHSLRALAEGGGHGFSPVLGSGSAAARVVEGRVADEAEEKFSGKLFSLTRLPIIGFESLSGEADRHIPSFCLELGRHQERLDAFLRILSRESTSIASIKNSGKLLEVQVESLYLQNLVLSLKDFCSDPKTFTSKPQAQNSDIPADIHPGNVTELRQRMLEIQRSLLMIQMTMGPDSVQTAKDTVKYMVQDKSISDTEATYLLKADWHAKRRAIK
jgi:hypothetical protein